MSALVLPLLLVLVTYSARDLRREQYVRPIAQTLLESAPENALLLTPADRTIFVVLYFQLIEGMRTDLSIVDSGLFAFDWYRARLAAQNEDIFIPEADNLDAFQRHNQVTRPFCLASVVSLPNEFPNGEPASTQSTGNSPYLHCIEVSH